MRWIVLGLVLRWRVLFSRGRAAFMAACLPFILTGLPFTGCGSPCQQVKASRCSGTVVELCGSNKRWQRVMDCAQVKAIKPGAPATWTCSEVPGKGCTCTPVKP